MGRSPLTLAALAAAAVPGLTIERTSLHTTGTTGEYDSAVVADADDRAFLIRVPNSREAYRTLEGELKSLSALSPGIRTRLPFSVPREVGRVEVDDTTALVYTFVPGVLLDVASLSSGSLLTHGVATAIAAIHDLPNGFVDDYTLPHDTEGDVREFTREAIAAAVRTRRVPQSLIERWTEAVDDDDLWDFEPTVVHGDLDDQSILIDGDRVSGMLSWGRLRIGDPATDLAWAVHAASIDAVDDLFGFYAQERASRPDPSLRRRAMLHGELAVARWLQFGLDRSDQQVIDDAALMLTTLQETVDGDFTMALVDPAFSAESTDTDADGDAEQTESAGDGAPAEATPVESAEDAGDEDSSISSVAPDAEITDDPESEQHQPTEPPAVPRP